MITVLGNTAPTSPVIGAKNRRRFLYLENPSAVDYRYSWNSGVTMTGDTTGMLLKAGERLFLTTEVTPWIGESLYFIAAAGTPDLIWHEKSA